MENRMTMLMKAERAWQLAWKAYRVARSSTNREIRIHSAKRFKKLFAYHHEILRKKDLMYPGK